VALPSMLYPSVTPSQSRNTPSRSLAEITPTMPPSLTLARSPTPNNEWPTALINRAICPRRHSGLPPCNREDMLFDDASPIEDPPPKPGRDRPKIFRF
jgi:hypothetical protein